MGPIKVLCSGPGLAFDSIRGRFRLTRNSSHGSDSTGSAGQEIEFFYPEVDSKKWGQEEKSNFEQGNIAFDLNLYAQTKP